MDMFIITLTTNMNTLIDIIKIINMITIININIIIIQNNISDSWPQTTGHMDGPSHSKWEPCQVKMMSRSFDFFHFWLV